MSNLSKRIATFFIISLFLAPISQVFSQDNHNWGKFKEEKIAYFNEKMNLTEPEKEVFWPIYDDHFNRILKINEDERSLLTFFNSNSEYMSEAEVSETVKKHFDLQQRRLDLELKYHGKFVDAIGEKKTMTMYTLEREYRMHVLRRFRGGQGQGPGKGQGRNRVGGGAVR